MFGGHDLSLDSCQSDLPISYRRPLISTSRTLVSHGEFTPLQSPDDRGETFLQLVGIIRCYCKIMSSNIKPFSHDSENKPTTAEFSACVGQTGISQCFQYVLGRLGDFSRELVNKLKFEISLFLKNSSRVVLCAN